MTNAQSVAIQEAEKALAAAKKGTDQNAINAAQAEVDRLKREANG